MNEKEQFETVRAGLLVRAPAKINLSMLIAGKRPDGFHEIETVMAKVNWYDEILIQRCRKAGIELVCKGPHWAPEGRENLIYQAAKLLLESCGAQANLKITLTKNIPAGSGLGSASSDAAATLIGLNQYLDLNTPKKDLAKLATRLGSDVPFFLNGPLAFCAGKGEKVKKLTRKFNFLALLIIPDVSVSTQKVYANYKHNAALYERFSGQIKSYIEKNRIDLVAKMCANMLQISCFGLVKCLAKLKAEIESLGIGPLCLSGSGSTMFCIIDGRNRQTARAYRDKRQKKLGCGSIIVSNNRW
ncbi:MAG: 4-(cytidine 5'-diphospho)-2-C-methyl-D-erythritol kinase [Planctomycetota bacterium]|nr:4-(cytidine 5'-diphospho)-2-C-methyl-D-erythritol kinase [Planctomycetota bacterium]